MFPQDGIFIKYVNFRLEWTVYTSYSNFHGDKTISTDLQLAVNS